MPRSEQLGPVCFVDTETTGLDPDRHEIWEVALIVPDPGGGTPDEYVWQLPVDLGRADAIALNIGRFHDRRRKPDEMTPLDHFAERFVTLTRGLHLVGAVISFDADRLWRLLRAHGECPMWHYHLIDVEALAAGWLAGRGGKPADDRGYGADCRPPWRSDALSMAVGVDADDFERHSALGDARWAKAIYEAVMG